MKAKKLMGMIAFASACVSLSAFASTTNGWFGVTVSGTDVHPVNIDVGYVAASDSKISLEDVAQTDPLVFTPTAGTVTNCTDDIYVIGASVALTPCDTNDFKDVNVTSAKAGVVVGFDENNETNYYGYAGGEWHKLTGATVVEQGNETAFCIVLNYRDSEAYFVIKENDGDKWHGPYGMPTGDDSALASIKAWGTGSISSVTGAFEVAVAAYGDKKYGSIAEASDAVKAASAADPTATVRVVNADGSTEDAGAVADNGLSKIVCEALGLPMNDSTANIAVAPAPTDTDVDEITLAVNLRAGAEPGAVGFKVSGDEKVYNANEIKIPLTAGTYTITPVLK